MAGESKYRLWQTAKKWITTQLVMSPMLATIATIVSGGFDCGKFHMSLALHAFSLAGALIVTMHHCMQKKCTTACSHIFSFSTHSSIQLKAKHATHVSQRNKIQFSKTYSTSFTIFICRSVPTSLDNNVTRMHRHPIHPIPLIATPRWRFYIFCPH